MNRGFWKATNLTTNQDTPRDNLLFAKNYVRFHLIKVPSIGGLGKPGEVLDC